MNYPYYIASFREQVFPSPPGLEQIYKHFNTRYREISSDDPSDLLRELRNIGLRPPYDQVDIYQVESNRPRCKLRWHEFVDLTV